MRNLDLFGETPVNFNEKTTRKQRVVRTQYLALEPVERPQMLFDLKDVDGNSIALNHEFDHCCGYEIQQFRNWVFKMSLAQIVLGSIDSLDSRSCLDWLYREPTEDAFDASTMATEMGLYIHNIREHIYGRLALLQKMFVDNEFPQWRDLSSENSNYTGWNELLKNIPTYQ